MPLSNESFEYLLGGDLGLQQQRAGVGGDHLLELVGLNLHHAANALLEFVLVLPQRGGMSTVIEEHGDGRILRGHNGGDSCNAQLREHGVNDESSL